MPAARVEVVNVATPETRGLDPITVPPLRKLTLPVGTVVPLTGLTVATKVSGEFWVTLIADDVRVVVVFTMVGEGGFTVSTRMPELEALNATDPA